MSANNPLVSIITINYNQFKITCEFLQSLKKLSYRNFETIVIDNASLEDHTNEIRSKFPFARIYRAKRNLGFTGGNNLGMKLSQGEFILLINNDTEISDQDLLEKLLDPFFKDAQVGMASPKILFFDRPGVIQFAGYNRINPLTGRNSQVGEGELDKGQYDQSGYTHYANGAAMMVKREVLENVGVLTDHFFLCYEELDWSAQATKYGYRIYYQANACILHKESITIGRTSPLKVYYNNRNRIMFMRRNSNTLNLILFGLYFTLFTVPKNVLTYLLKFQFEHLNAFIAAILWNVSNINIYKRMPFRTKLDDVSLQTMIEI